MLGRMPSRGKGIYWGNDCHPLGSGKAVGDAQRKELCGEMTSHAETLIVGRMALEC